MHRNLLIAGDENGRMVYWDVNRPVGPPVQVPEGRGGAGMGRDVMGQDGTGQDGSLQLRCRGRNME